MKHFIELTQSTAGVLPQVRQARADEAFPQLAESQGFHLWHPGDAVSAKGRRLLIGVATYSPADMALLDDLASRLTSLGSAAPRVDLFNMRDVSSMEGFNAYVAGVGPVHQSPVVALYEDGRLASKATGAQARRLADEVFKASGPTAAKPEAIRARSVAAAR